MSNELTMTETADLRLLSEAEMDEASGGILPLIGLAVAGFAAGFGAGTVAANYYYTGNFWGDWDFD